MEAGALLLQPVTLPGGEAPHPLLRLQIDHDGMERSQPNQGKGVDGAQQVEAESPAITLVGQAGIYETIAEHDLA